MRSSSPQSGSHEQASLIIYPTARYSFNFLASCRVLAHITQPLDCLIPNLQLQLQTLEKFRQSPERVCEIPYKLIELETIVAEMELSLRKIKAAFAKSDVTDCIMQKLRSILKEVRRAAQRHESSGALTAFVRFAVSARENPTCRVRGGRPRVLPLPQLPLRSEWRELEQVEATTADTQHRHSPVCCFPTL